MDYAHTFRSGHNYDNEEAGNTWGSGSPSAYGGEGYAYSQKPNDAYEYDEFTNPLDQLVRIPVSFAHLYHFLYDKVLLSYVKKC